MQFRQLRQILQHIVLASLPVSAGGCLDALLDPAGEDCVEHFTRTIPIETPAEPPLQLGVDSCRVDVDACLALCNMALERAGAGASASECKVTFEGSTANVEVGYYISNGGAGCPSEGRRPEGLVLPHRLDATNPVGAWLAEAAWLEAASVHAFVNLARELGLHGAPHGLVRWALVAARDEVRHTGLMTRLALRYGARPPAPEVKLPDHRTLEQLAIENAVEGCVRETWGAVIALWQSRTARDPQVRATFATIARDEAHHAALAWAVDAWARPQLDQAALARIDAARQAAARELLEHHGGTPLAALGLPHASQARDLVARAHDSLWSSGGVSCRA